MYGSVVKSSIEAFNQYEQNKKISQRFQARGYASDLLNQMDEFKDREKRKYNEMTEKEKMIN